VEIDENGLDRAGKSLKKVGEEVAKLKAKDATILQVSKRAKGASILTKKCEATKPLLTHSCSRASLNLASLGAERVQ